MRADTLLVLALASMATGCAARMPDVLSGRVCGVPAGVSARLQIRDNDFGIVLQRQELTEQGGFRFSNLNHQRYDLCLVVDRGEAGSSERVLLADVSPRFVGELWLDDLGPWGRPGGRYGQESEERNAAGDQ